MTMKVEVIPIAHESANLTYVTVNMEGHCLRQGKW